MTFVSLGTHDTTPGRSTEEDIAGQRSTLLEAAEPSIFRMLDSLREA